MENDWLDRNEYPFESKWINLPAGRMHYIEEGKGDVLLFLHGNPVWSFTYRKLVKILLHHFRCIAIDYIGFGLSDKPGDWTYLPEQHSECISEFIRQKGLKSITLIVNDWGGPIGLNYAVNNRGNVKGLIIFNTFMWSVKGDRHFERFSAFMGGRFGKFLILYFNFFGRVVMKMAYGDRSKLLPKIKEQLIKPMASKKDRIGCWVFPREIIHSSQWLNSIWEKKGNLKNIPALIIWGMKDIAFRQKELETFESFLPNRKLIALKDAGHYVQEEASEIIMDPILKFLKNGRRK